MLNQTILYKEWWPSQDFNFRQRKTNKLNYLSEILAIQQIMPQILYLIKDYFEKNKHVFSVPAQKLIEQLLNNQPNCSADHEYLIHYLK